MPSSEPTTGEHRRTGDGRRRRTTAAAATLVKSRIWRSVASCWTSIGSPAFWSMLSPTARSSNSSSPSTRNLTPIEGGLVASWV